MRRRPQTILALAAVAMAMPGAAPGKVDALGQRAPINVEAPSIVGDLIEGRTLTALAGKWLGPTKRYRYQWLRCGSDGAACGTISDATAAKYVLRAADIGSTIAVAVTATNKNGSTLAISKPTGAVAPSAGSTSPGETTTSVTTTTAPEPTPPPPAPTPPPPAPTPPPPAPTPPRFIGDWETGDATPWDWGAQCANIGPASMLNQPSRGTLSVVTAPVEQGTYSGKFSLPAYTSSSNACEVLRHRTLAAGGVYGTNGHDWYALALNFPTGWQEPSSAFWGLLVAQFNYQRITGPPVGLYAHADHVNITLQSGYCVFMGACSYTTGNDAYKAGTLGVTLRAIPSTRFRLDAWHQLIVHVQWTTDSTGRIEVWHRLKGDATWSKTVDFSGYPTLQWSDTVPLSALPTYDQSADKIGAYRGPAAFPLTIWNDGFCVATSFDSAAGCL
jgi:Polysaccharide lyase